MLLAISHGICCTSGDVDEAEVAVHLNNFERSAVVLQIAQVV